MFDYNLNTEKIETDMFFMYCISYKYKNPSKLIHIYFISSSSSP